MADVNRQDLIRGMMAEVDGLSYAMASASLEALLTCVTQALTEGKTVVLRDFGKFGVRQRRARAGTHPQTHAALEIPAATIPYFTASPTLKRLVNADALAQRPARR